MLIVFLLLLLLLRCRCLALNAMLNILFSFQLSFSFIVRKSEESVSVAESITSSTNALLKRPPNIVRPHTHTYRHTHTQRAITSSERTLWETITNFVLVKL